MVGRLRRLCGGGWSDKTKLILISTLVEVVVEVEVELGNMQNDLEQSIFELAGQNFAKK